ncbi:hypothetical protein E2542_SST21453 [Spatholobus suberectus]|nr:hypothetical protein E2542_SST21453 [Spatholobus suberectus]
MEGESVVNLRRFLHSSSHAWTKAMSGEDETAHITSGASRIASNSIWGEGLKARLRHVMSTPSTWWRYYGTGIMTEG